jgi:hypothetical protein
MSIVKEDATVNPAMEARNETPLKEQSKLLWPKLHNRRSIVP